MNLVAKCLLGYMAIHILLIALVEAYFCVPLQMVQPLLLVVLAVITLLNAKKIILDRSDIIIIFLLIFLNIYYTLIDARGLIFFKMSYILILAILISKIVLPNISLRRYTKKIETIYLIILAALVFEYLFLVFFGETFIKNLLMCHGQVTGTRGYIPLYNMTKEFLPYHITGLNSIMLGGQTASQLAVIIFIWSFYKYRSTDYRFYTMTSLLAILMLLLSPTVTSIFLLFFSIIIIYLFDLRGKLKKKIINFYIIYPIVLMVLLTFVLILTILISKHSSLDLIYEKYILVNIMGFSYFNLNEILLGVSYEKYLDLFKIGEIAFLDQLQKFGFIGIGVFYISILYFILRAITNKTTSHVISNVIIIIIYVLGTAHYPVMFKIGVADLFILHLAYIIYIGSSSRKSNRIASLS